MYSDPHSLRRLALLLALAAPLALAACGKKGNPRPPVQLVPATTRDLVARQRGPELAFELAYPTTTVAGTPLPRLAAVELLAFPLPAGAAPTAVTPAQFTANAKPVVTLTGGDLAAAVAGDRIVIRLLLTDVVPGEPVGTLIFATRTLAESGKVSALSNLAPLTPATPPAPPPSLEVVPEADAIALSWPASEAEPPPVGYFIYRRAAGQRSYGKPLAGVLFGTSSHRDATAVYGNRYIYAVTTVATPDPLVESALSPEREVAYEDRFPPLPPPQVVALAEREQVQLRWVASPSADTTGYLVYRREGEGESAGDWRQLTAEPIPGLEFRDSGLASGLAVRYRVVPVDAAGNRGEPGSEASTTVQ